MNVIATYRGKPVQVSFGDLPVPVTIRLIGPHLHTGLFTVERYTVNNKGFEVDIDQERFATETEALAYVATIQSRHASRGREAPQPRE